jgi:hypothetical protein
MRMLAREAQDELKDYEFIVEAQGASIEATFAKV